jgi:hypothetical protein
MKNLLTLLCIAVLAFANVTFAQYGGGTRSGGSSSVLVKDTCPDGDTSGSYFDNSCGDDDMMDDEDDMMDLEEEIEDNNEEIIEENEEDDMMDDDADEGTSLLDALKNRDSDTTTPGLNTNGEGLEGTDGFVLPGLLAATGAEL